MDSCTAYQIVVGLTLWCHCQCSAQHQSICCGWCSMNKGHKDSPLPKQFTINMAKKRPEVAYEVK